MSAEDSSDGDEYVYCYECGAEIKRHAEICNECGVRQTAVSQSGPGQSNAPSQSGPGQSNAPSQSGPGQSNTPSQTAGRQGQQPSPESTDLTDEYSVLQWLGSAVVSIVTFPAGLLVPAYLFYKAQNGTGKKQSGLESWTAILFGIIGIIAVELGGDTAAKVLWGLSVVTIGVGLFVVMGA